MSESEIEQTVHRLVADNRAVTGRGTPEEEIVRQAVRRDMSVSEACDAIEGLQMVGKIYKIRPGLLCPCEDPDSKRVVDA